MECSGTPKHRGHEGGAQLRRSPARPGWKSGRGTPHHQRSPPGIAPGDLPVSPGQSPSVVGGPSVEGVGRCRRGFDTNYPIRLPTEGDIRANLAHPDPRASRGVIPPTFSRKPSQPTRHVLCANSHGRCSIPAMSSGRRSDVDHSDRGGRP